MELLKIVQLEHYIRERRLFRLEGTFALRNGDRVGIVGSNGAGKSTLLAILAGRLEPDAGQVIRGCRIAELTQQDGGRGLSADEDVAAQKGELAGEALKRWRTADEEAVLAHGSGGERTRRNLARLLGSGAELLIADEPTSHLDVEGIRQLADRFANYRGAVLLVSHDRELLDRVCTRIIEIDEAQLTVFEGNYSAYKQEKQARREREKLEYEQYEKEKARLEAAIIDKKEQSRAAGKRPRGMSDSEARLIPGFAKKQGAKAKLDKAAKALESRLERLEVKQKPREYAAPLFDAELHEPCRSKHVLQADGLTARYGDRTLFRELKLDVRPGMRIAILGPNGAGKTTLLRTVSERPEGIRYSPSCRIAYFRQDLGGLDEGKTILQNVLATSRYLESHVRTVLARTLFKRDDVFKRVGDLSGGERIKTNLMKLFLSDSNVLLLDEPTNYLDIFARESLEEALSEYPGTILFASHDAAFVKRVATHHLRVSDGRWTFSDNHADTPLTGELRAEQADPSADEVMLIEREIAETLGRLSALRLEEADREALDLKFQQLMARKKEIAIR